MGLLDEAIREHLELKRRHGADPTEVAQLEREAFGPAPSTPAPLDLPSRDDADEHDPQPADATDDEAPTRLQRLPHPDEREELTWEDAATEGPEPDPQSTVAFDPSELADAHGSRRGSGQVPDTAEHDPREPSDERP